MTPASGTVTIPAAAGPVPATATINLTITTTAQADLTQASPFLAAVAGAYTQNASIVFTDTQYGPLWPTCSPQALTIPSPGTATVTLTLHNASAATATVNLVIGTLFNGTASPSAKTPYSRARLHRQPHNCRHHRHRHTSQRRHPRQPRRHHQRHRARLQHPQHRLLLRCDPLNPTATTKTHRSALP